MPQLHFKKIGGVRYLATYRDSYRTPSTEPGTFEFRVACREAGYDVVGEPKAEEQYNFVTDSFDLTIRAYVEKV